MTNDRIINVEGSRYFVAAPPSPSLELIIWDEDGDPVMTLPSHWADSTDADLSTVIWAYRHGYALGLEVESESKAAEIRKAIGAMAEA